MSHYVEPDEILSANQPDPECIRVTGRKWYSTGVNTQEVLIAEGTTVSTLVSDFFRGMDQVKLYTPEQSINLSTHCVVFIDGVKIPKDKWATFTVKLDSRVHIYEGVKGGGSSGSSKQIITGVLLMTAAVVASIATFGGGSAALGGAFAFMTETGVAATLMSGAFAMGASMLIGGTMALLFPQALPSSNAIQSQATETSQAYSVTGAQNSANPEGYIPVILGKHKITPPLFARSYTKWIGNTQYFYMLVCLGQPDLTVKDIKIGETPIDDYKNVKYRIVDSNGSGLQYFAKQYYENSVGASVDTVGEWQQRTIGECQEFNIDLQFNGLIVVKSTVTSDGSQDASVTAYFWVQYKKVSESEAEWKDVFKGGISGRTYDLVMKTVGESNLEKAEYEIRVQRYQESTTGTGFANTWVDDCTWSTYRSINYGSAFKTKLPWKVMELEIMASEQLSGYVSDLNMVVTSVCDVFDSARGEWVKTGTNSPPYLARFALTSPYMLPQPFKASRIHDESFKIAGDYCYANNLTCNFICDTETLLWQRLTQILSCGRCAVTTDMDGQWGVIIDAPGKEVKQLFTPINSWGFNYARNYADMPHALRVSFVNEENDYAQEEQYVFWDGYSEDGADGTKVAEDILAWSYPGVTNWNQLYKLARMHMAKLKHRQIASSLNTDWEWLTVRRGDLVGISHNAEFNTFGEGRITALIYDVEGTEVIVIDTADIPKDTSGKNLIPIGVKLNDSIVFNEPAPAKYGINVRYDTSKVATYEIEAFYGEEPHEDLYFKQALVEASVPNIGDLCTVSLLEVRYAEYLFAGVVPGERVTGEIALIPYAMDAIESAIAGEIPPYVPPIINESIGNSKVLPTPDIIQIRSDEKAMLFSQGTHIIRLQVYGAYKASAFNGSEVNMEIEARFVDTESSDITTTVLYGQSALGSNNAYVTDVVENAYYDIRIRAMHLSGIVSNWSEPVRHKIVGRTTPPTPPTNLIIEGTTLIIEHDNRPLDVVGYVIYMSKDEDALFNECTQITMPYTGSSNFDFTAYKGVRTFYVKAIDSVGLLSTPAHINVALPPSPTAVYIDGTTLVIEQDNRPSQVVGHVIYIGMDDTDTLEMSTQLTEPYITNGLFDFTKYQGTARIFYVRTIDAIGLLSEPVSVKINMGDVLPDNIILTWSELNKDWSGTKINSVVDAEDRLSAISSILRYVQYDETVRYPQLSDDLAYSQLATDLAYAQEPMPLMYPQGNKDLMYPSGNGTQVEYVYAVYIDSMHLGSYLFVEPLIYSGRVLNIQYRTYSSPLHYPQDATDLAYPQDATDLAYGQQIAGTWKIMPDKLSLSVTGQYDIKVTSRADSFAIFDDILTHVDVPDKEYAFEDLNISADGLTRCPIKANYFRKITNIQLSLQYEDGDTGISPEFVRGSETYSGDFVRLSPMIRILDKDKNLTKGNVDVVIKGY